MGDEKMSVEEQEQESPYFPDVVGVVHGEEKGATNVGTNSAWMRRHLSGSIYVWAFGEKADDKDLDPTLSERFIAWLVLFVQGFAYTTLIVLAKHIPEDNSDDDVEYYYLLPSVVGAMYLLVASTAHDFRAGFSLLVDGLCVGHHVFGIGILALYGLMLSAAMTVIVSTSENSETVVINAVTVIFIADLDEKALKFFWTVPQKWRLFWAIESLGISFVLALIAVYHIRREGSIFTDHNSIFVKYESWFYWMLNPGAVTICCYWLSASLQGLSELCSESFEQGEQLTTRFIVARGLTGLLGIIKRVKQSLLERPWFCAVQGVWLVQGVISWWILVTERGLPVALTVFDDIDDSGSDDLKISKEYFSFAISNAALVSGLTIKALGVFLPRHDSITAIQEPRRFSVENGPRKPCSGRATDSCVSSLLVGWGTGYWVTSLLLVLGVSWRRGGWHGAPLALRVIGYVFVPCFFVVCVFTVADSDFLGTRLGVFIKPAVEIMKNRRKFAYWTMATVFRDAFLAWLILCFLLMVDVHIYTKT